MNMPLVTMITILPFPAEVLLAVTVVNDAADRGRIRQQTEEQYGKIARHNWMT